MYFLRYCSHTPGDTQSLQQDRFKATIGSNIQTNASRNTQKVAYGRHPHPQPQEPAGVIVRLRFDSLSLSLDQQQQHLWPSRLIQVRYWRVKVGMMRHCISRRV
jgi:hypothetical protein